MDDSLKEILNKHWATLVRYINPAQSLIDVLVADKVLPAAMIEDIKKGPTRREKNEILLKSIKLRGNMSYRKFRDAMLKCGQIFIADLLFEEEGAMTFVEESDFAGFPALKISLSPAALKQFVLFLDAKIRARVLKSEWKTNSSRRLDLTLTRAEDNKSQNQAHVSAIEREEKIKQLSAEMSVKNDVIRSLSLDINILNAEVESFTQRYSTDSKLTPPTKLTDTPPDKDAPPTLPTQKPPTVRQDEPSVADKPLVPANMPPANKYTSRFGFFDKALALVNSKLTSVLGLPVGSDGEVTRIDIIEGRAVQIQELVTRLEDSLSRAHKDRDVAISLLLPDTQQKFSSAVAGVQRYLLQEQRQRYALMKDIDRLSRKLRGMTSPKPTSGLYALQQSAVTGKPAADKVDYRFLSNHICLVTADAEHFRKKLEWLEVDMKTLQSEVVRLRLQTTANSKAAPAE